MGWDIKEKGNSFKLKENINMNPTHKNDCYHCSMLKTHEELKGKGGWVLSREATKQRNCMILLSTKSWWKKKCQRQLKKPLQSST